MSKMVNISGMRFGMLTAIKPTEERKSGCVVWECKCDCGNTCYVSSNHLQSGGTKSCGCTKTLSISGKRFGMLTAIKPTEERRDNCIVWECKCDCGNTCYVQSTSLTKGITKSCGCMTVVNLAGKRFGILTAIKPTARKSGNCIVWECKCDCGNTCYVPVNRLESGATRSCGCLRKRKPEYLNAKDVSGKRFGLLTATKPMNGMSDSGYRLWECKCDCGNICYVPISKLCNGFAKSCGCKELVNLPSGELRLEGKRFGRLTALKPTGRRSGRCIVWECKCDCGNTCYVPSARLNAGVTKSCGCLAKERTREACQVDISGKRFGNLVAIKPTNDRKFGTIVWECKCDCGNVCYAPATKLIQGVKTVCGRDCSKSAKKYKDISGIRFGKLTAIKPTQERKSNSVVWECKCDCGNTCYVSSMYLCVGRTTSCGCLRGVSANVDR